MRKLPQNDKMQYMPHRAYTAFWEIVLWNYIAAEPGPDGSRGKTGDLLKVPVHGGKGGIAGAGCNFGKAHGGVRLHKLLCIVDPGLG